MVHDKAKSSPNRGMDLEVEDWVKSSKLEKSFSNKNIKKRDYT